MNILYSKHSS